jgi:hypothetical protein
VEIPYINQRRNDSAALTAQVARHQSAASFWAVVDEAWVREKQIGGSGGSLEPPAPILGPPGPLLTHLHTVYMACSECLPTRLNPLAERTCFSQAWVVNVTDFLPHHPCVRPRAPAAHWPAGGARHTPRLALLIPAHSCTRAANARTVKSGKRSDSPKPLPADLIFSCPMHAVSGVWLRYGGRA